MALSDAILTRLLLLHPKIIDLSLERMHRILLRLGNPEARLPSVIHVAGTNGKGSTVAFARAILEAAGLTVHCYTSPHLVKFHERIRVAGELISDERLSLLLAECEAANGGEPITFFEITTAAAFLAFARTPADYLILEVGLGGRLDATNVIDRPAVTCITSIGLDHQQYLGNTIQEIAGEKAGILKRGVPAIIGRMPLEARQAIETVAARISAPLHIAQQDWQAIEEHGRLVFQDDAGLLDLPLPALKGIHQIDNAGNAIAIIRGLCDPRITQDAIAAGLKNVSWPARMQRLSRGHLTKAMPEACELWLDGGHNPDAGEVLAQTLADMHKRPTKPLVLIWGMLNTKDAARYLRPLAPMASLVITLTIPGEANAIPADQLMRVAQSLVARSMIAATLEDALRQAFAHKPAARILVCGSLYLAGHVLAAHSGEAMSPVSGTAR